MADSLTPPALGWDHVSPGWPFYFEACARWQAGDDRGAALLARLAVETHVRMALSTHCPGERWRDLHQAGSRLRRAGVVNNRTRKELRRLVRPANEAVHGTVESAGIRALLAAAPVLLRCWL